MNCTLRRCWRSASPSSDRTSTPSISTWPPRAGMSRAAARAVVDLPDPDSPTRPRVRPGGMSKETPSTAKSWAGLARKPSRLTENRTSRSRTRNAGRSGRRNRAHVRTRPGMPAGRLVPVLASLAARIGRSRRHRSLTRGQRGANRQRSRPNSAREGTMPGISMRSSGSSVTSVLQVRNARDEPLGVGMVRLAQDVAHRAFLDHAPRVHDHHPLGHLRDHPHVVGDEDDRGPRLLAKRLQQVEDLGLHGDVEGGGRLVRDEDPRPAGERDGDHHPLAHAAGELMRIVVRPPPRKGDAHRVEQLDGAVPGGAPAEVLVPSQHLRNLLADRVDRIERRHRLLEDHRDRVAPDVAQVRVRGPGEVLVRKEDGAARDAPRRRGDEPHDGERGHRLAAPGLPHQTQGGPRVELDREAIEHRHGAVAGGELHGEVAQAKERPGPRLVHRWRSFGLSASFKPSPTRLIASTVMKMKNPGIATVQPASRM